MTSVTCENIVALGGIQRWWYTLNYGFQSRRIAVAVLVISALVILVYLLSTPEEITLWSLLQEKIQGDRVGFVIQVITFLAVSGIWFTELKKEWRDSLEKYLSVSFVYGGKPRIRCRYAPLTGESDIRSMAQSFGQSLNCGGRLPIAPAISRLQWQIEQQQGSREKTSLLNGGKPFLHYDVTVRLTQDITVLCKKEEEGKDRGNREGKTDGRSPLEISSGEFLLWSYPFDPPTEKDVKKHANDRCD